MSKTQGIRKVDLYIGSLGTSALYGAGSGSSGAVVASTNIVLLDDDGFEATRDANDAITIAGGTGLETSASASTLTIDHSTGDEGDLHTNYAEHDQAETITATWTWGTTNKIQLRDSGLAVYSSVDGQLDIDADTELEITAPTVQIVAATLIDLEGTTRLDTANQLQFRDTDLRIYSSADGQMDIDADTELEITAPTVQIVAATLIDLEGTTRLDTANQLQFRDTALRIYSSADGQLDIDADTEIELTAPTIQLVAATTVRVDGDTEMDGDLQFIGTQTISTSADHLILQPADQIQLDPQGDEMIFSNWGAGKAFESDDYVSQTTGFSIAYGSSGGHADFRSMFANELHVQAFIADIYQAAVGALIITKSRARLSRDFLVPLTSAIVDVDTVNDHFNVSGDQTTILATLDGFNVSGSTGNDGQWTVASLNYDGVAGETEIYTNEDITNAVVDGTIYFQNTLYVEDLEGWDDTQLFTADDYVLVRVIDTSGGGLVVADVWGVVTDYTDLAGGEQSYTFTVTDDGSVAGDSVYTGSIALDYGQQGSGSQGIWTATVLDAAGAPYSQVATWDTNPWTAGNWTTNVRLGNLDGIAGIGLEYGLWAGQGTGSDDAYLVLTDSSADLHNLPLTIHDGVNTRIYLDPSTPYLSVGSTAPTAYLTGDGFWVGNSAGTYKMHLGDTDGERLQWDGTDLYIYSAAGDYIWLDAGDGIKMYHNSSIGFHATAAGALLVGNAAAGQYPKLYYDGTDLYIQGSANERVMLDADDGVKIYGNNTLRFHAKTTGVVQMGNVAGHPKFNYDGTDVYITATANDYIWLDADGGIKLYSNGTRQFLADPTGYCVVGIGTAENVLINASGVQLRDSATVYGIFAATTTIGLTTAEHVEISAANGLRMMDNATCRGQWHTSGHVYIGADISAAGSTAVQISAANALASISGNTTLDQNDILIGDDSAGGANLWWDASAGYLYFRADDRQMRMNSYGMQMQLYDDGLTAYANIGLVWKDQFSGDNDDLAQIRYEENGFDSDDVFRIIAGGDGLTAYPQLIFEQNYTNGGLQERVPIRCMGATRRVGIYSGSSPDAVLHVVNSSSAGEGIPVGHFANDKTDSGYPVLKLEQADVDQEFISFVGTAAAGNLTYSIVDEGDQASETRAGWLQVYVQDDGNQIADSSYFIPIYTLS